jgi:hypothetical protein
MKKKIGENKGWIQKPQNVVGFRRNIFEWDPALRALTLPCVGLLLR